jgi:hypothetical protein
VVSRRTGVLDGGGEEERRRGEERTRALINSEGRTRALINSERRGEEEIKATSGVT